jgi:hypothetical protein
MTDMSELEPGFESPPVPDAAIIDDADDDQTVPIVAYEITSYGADPEAELLVRRQQRDEILVPTFQRSYVWTQPQASRFIESLLLGLPVPGIFLAIDPDTGKQLVIDGQQRLKTLRFFYEGYFNPAADGKLKRVFALQSVQKPFADATYATLDQRDRMRLDTAIIHATIVRQTTPPSDDTSLYHIFERLNSGGQRLTPQEIRAAIYHGPLQRLLADLNDHPSWRTLFGRKHSRLKDQELILRFFALLLDRSSYARPMHEFLSRFAKKRRSPGDETLREYADLFTRTTDSLLREIGDRAFRAEGRFNMALADSVLVGVAERVRGNRPSTVPLKAAFDQLLRDGDFQLATTRATADEAQVALRLAKAVTAFTTSR